MQPAHFDASAPFFLASDSRKVSVMNNASNPDSVQPKNTNSMFNQFKTSFNSGRHVHGHIWLERLELVRPVGFEPTTYRLEGGCSNPLSYGRP